MFAIQTGVIGGPTQIAVIVFPPVKIEPIMLK
jgi:hypothetical protein